ncbi:unnamed protein product [Bursaphelenchus okinawaensis]|uniref:Prokaryotic-type class I peptide chain release factors domain-containing protein n=1 Tax=Bursaphelenchus okinawaensis TaxID=465554 RepID=A0A811LPE8_9BILA|nr:unnamed protein product [Bursaphelenchus okinawaensis]CAG9125349.1 unnamed protein product [Bursaphelenchus okinawaensis]
MFLDKLLAWSSLATTRSWIGIGRWSTLSSYSQQIKQEKAKVKIGGGGAAAQRARKLLKGYQFPEIRADDCQQQFISGWGPGGQKVNTAQNAVQLKHIPTNVSVKVHESRLLPENVSIAYERLKYAVDKHINKDECYTAQFDRITREYEQKMKSQRRKRREAKMESKVPSDEAG